MNQIHLEILKKNLDTLNLSAEWVKRSLEQCLPIGVKETFSKDEFDKFENLASRYARTTDMLVNKVFRSIDTLESEDIGTIIDIMNRAEKGEIIQSAGILHTIKDLRNDIAHEYQINEIPRFFAGVLAYTPVLLKIIANTNNYCAKYLDFAGQLRIQI